MEAPISDAEIVDPSTLCKRGRSRLTRGIPEMLSAEARVFPFWVVIRGAKVGRARQINQPGLQRRDSL